MPTEELFGNYNVLDGDGAVSPIDALIVINELNEDPLGIIAILVGLAEEARAEVVKEAGLRSDGELVQAVWSGGWKLSGYDGKGATVGYQDGNDLILSLGLDPKAVWGSDGASLVAIWGTGGVAVGGTGGVAVEAVWGSDGASFKAVWGSDGASFTAVWGSDGASIKAVFEPNAKPVLDGVWKAPAGFEPVTLERGYVGETEKNLGADAFVFLDADGDGDMDLAFALFGDGAGDGKDVAVGPPFYDVDGDGAAKGGDVPKEEITIVFEHVRFEDAELMSMTIEIGMA